MRGMGQPKAMMRGLWVGLQESKLNNCYSLMNECEVEAVDENETENPIKPKLCKNNFLDTSDVMRNTNGTAS